METASLMHVIQTNNPNAANNQALWDIYLAMNVANKTAIELRAKNHDLAVLALHNSCMPEALHDYAMSYMQGKFYRYKTKKNKQTQILRERRS